MKAMNELPKVMEASAKPENSEAAGFPSEPLPMPGRASESAGASPARSPQASSSKCEFVPYITNEDAEKGIQAGRYLRGTCVVNKKYSSAICFVRNPEWGADVLIEGKADRNRALPGDAVVVEVHDREKWKDVLNSNTAITPGSLQGCPAPSIRSRSDDLKLAPHERSMLPGSRPICRALHGLSKPEEPLKTVDPVFQFPDNKLVTGKIVLVQNPGHATTHVCRALGPVTHPNGTQKTWLRFAPADEQYPHIDVQTKKIPKDARKRIEDALVHLELKRWEVGRQFPEAVVLGVLGEKGQAEDEVKAILVQNGTQYTDEFDEACLEGIEDRFEIPGEEELKRSNRRDMRLGAEHERFVCTIDPASARDLDDALSCDYLGDGRYRIGVHIADVSTFVEAGSALDLEAKKRATSVYLVHKVIPMLPRKLCEEHCSLNTLGDKYAFTVEWIMDSSGNIVSEWFGQTVIRSQCKMTYADAQSIIDGTFSPERLDLTHLPQDKHQWTVDRLTESVTGLWGVASKIRTRRQAEGSLSLNQPKMYFDFKDGDTTVAPEGWHMHTSGEANWLVEQFMVLANSRVTQKCIEYCPDVAMARYHLKPEKKRFEPLVKALSKQGVELDVSSGAAMGESLKKLRDHPQIGVINTLAVRCMRPAKYCCTSEAKEHSLSHFAAKLEYYTHFTSPIRRYADLVVHRVLKCALEVEALYKERKAVADEGDEVTILKSDLKSGDLLLTEEEMASVAAICNERKEEARKASDQCVVLYYNLYLYKLFLEHGDDPESVPGFKERHQATLVKVQEKGFTIHISSIGVDKELFHNNGQQDQLWLGTNKSNPKEGSMEIEWASGTQTASMLTTFDVLVWHKESSKTLDFVCQLQPPTSP